MSEFDNSKFKSWMDQYGDRLIENGYPILPIVPGEKFPGRFVRGNWVGYSGWQRHGTRGTMNFELDSWRKWPACGIGIAGGVVVGLDIDVLDAKVCLEIDAMTVKMCGDTPAIRIGRAPKRLRVYRTNRPFAGRKRLPIELLALGQQFVAYAIHPITGKPYSWIEDELVNLDISSLPVIDEALALRWLDAAYDMVPMELRPKTLAEGSTGQAVFSGDARGTLEAVQAALIHVPNEDLDGASWVRIGNAIKAALGEEGRDLWIDWSESSGKSGSSGKRDTAARRWATFQPRSVGAGTIYYLAQQRGWRPPPDMILNGYVADAVAAQRMAEAEGSPNPAAALIARAQAFADGLHVVAEPSGEEGDQEPAEGGETLLDLVRPTVRSSGQPRPAGRPAPAGIMDVGGLLGHMISEILESAIRPQPLLALGASLSAVAALAGRRYRTETGLMSNIYVAGICDSGGGKDHAAECMRDAMSAAGLDRYLGGEGIASGTALLTSLQRHPALLFQIDEFGPFMSSVTGMKAAPHKAEIMQELLKLFSRSKGTYRGIEYANQQLRKRIDIEQPCVCFHGTTTPSTFWNALQNGAMKDGSLARFIVFVSDDAYPDQRFRPPMFKPSDSLLEGMKAITIGATGHSSGGNLSDLMSATVRMEPYTVPMDRAAESSHNHHLGDQQDWLRSAAGTDKTSIIARIGENAVKCAMLRAISDDPGSPIITLECVEWAWSIVTHCTDILLRESENFIADNEQDGKHKKTLELIRKAGGKGLTRTELMRATHFLGDRRESVFSALVEGGQIALEKVTPLGGKKPTLLYRYVDESGSQPASRPAGSTTH